MNSPVDPAAGIAPFFNHLPVRIQFGEGVAERLRDVAEQAAARRVVVIIDAGLEQNSPAVASALARLASAGGAVVREVKDRGEPTQAVVDAAAATIRDARADAVVAIGGGSVIDTAKAARLCAQRALPYARVVESLGELLPPVIPLIAIPTTAGTGSEVSGGAVITDEASSRKTGIASPHLRPQYALVDPLLTHSVPPAMTAYTGVDALAQAIAGMVAKVRTPIGDAIALEAIRLLGRSLVAAYRDGHNAGARSEVAAGSLMAGLTMNISDCAAEHSLGQAIGGEFHVPHGLTVGVVLAETLERERHVVPAQLERVADALRAPGNSAGSAGNRAAQGAGDGSRAVAAVRNLLAELNFPVLSSLGVRSTHLARLTKLAQADFFITQAPRPWSTSEVHDAFAAALALSDRQGPSA